MNNGGFTLIESLVVISILTLMTSFLILYNRTGELQIIILKEKANLIGTILRAKNLALGTLVTESAGVITCGYGVYIENNSYFIYRDLASDCQISDQSYSGNSSGEKLEGETYKLLPAVQFFQNEVNDILFVPPLPDVFFDGSKAVGEKIIRLSDISRDTKSEIIINNAGQISEQ